MGEWIRVEDSGNVPVAIGTLIDIRQRDGSVFYSWPYLTETDALMIGDLGGVDNTGRHPDDIIAYRLSDTDDKAKREARMELFRGIAKSKEFLIEETLKPREKVK